MTTVFHLFETATSTDYTVEVNGSAATGVTKSTTYFTFNTAPLTGSVITAVYDSDGDHLKAYTIGVRRAGYPIGVFSLCENMSNIATGICSHAEGYLTNAGGKNSHAEGFDTSAQDDNAHAEGNGSRAFGDSSHAEGYYSFIPTGAKGAHAQNIGTVARYEGQTAIGSYNTDDIEGTPSNLGDSLSYFAFVVGNGQEFSRSDAFAVTWDGDVKANGDVNAAGDITAKGDVVAYSGESEETSLYNLMSSIPTNTSDLNNDSHFVDLTSSKPLFKKVSVQKTFSISAGSTANQSFAPASADVPSGYTRVGLCSWNTANGNVFIVTCTGTTITFGNKSSSSVTCTNAQVDWLYIRSSI